MSGANPPCYHKAMAYPAYRIPTAWLSYVLPLLILACGDEEPKEEQSDWEPGAGSGAAMVTGGSGPATGGTDNGGGTGGGGGDGTGSVACIPACAGVECGGDDGCAGACQDGCAALTECGPGDCNFDPVSFSTDVYPLFATCGSMACHGGPRKASGLDLASAAGAHAGLVGVNSIAAGCTQRVLVVAGNPSSSYLINKLLGVDICGGRMPKLGSTFTEPQLDTVRAWVANGALND